MLGTIGRSGRPRPVLVVAAVAALCGAGASSTAAADWLPARALATAGGGSSSVAAAGSGDATVLFTQSGAVAATRHPAGAGGFARLPDLATDSQHELILAALASNRAGDRVAVWRVNLGSGNYRLMFAAAAAGEAFGSATQIGPDGSYSTPVAAVGDGGDAAIVFRHVDTVEAVTRDGAGGAFTDLTTPKALAQSPQSSGPPAVAVDGSGNVRVAFSDSDFNIATWLHARGGTWGTGLGLAREVGTVFSAPRLAATADGKMLLSMSVVQSNSPFGSATAVIDGTVAGTWDPQSYAKLSDFVADLSSSEVTLDDAGGAVVTWRDNTNSKIVASVRPVGGSFPAPSGAQAFAVPDVTVGPVLAGNGRGDTVLAWSSLDDPPQLLRAHAARKPAGAGSFGADTVLAEPGELAIQHAVVRGAAVDEAGDAVVIWDAITLPSAPVGVAAAVYDAGPVLGAPAIPATATAGEPVAFSVPAPTGTWAAVGAPSWTFGDDTAAAEGTSVTHTFAAAGNPTVTVTATDAAGGTASAGSPIAVSAPIAPVPQTPQPQAPPASKPPAQAAFGADTLVTLALSAKRIPAKGPLKLVVTNANGFAVTGKLSAAAVAGKRRIGLKAKWFTVAARAKATVALSLPAALRRTLARKHKLTFRVTATVSDPAGHGRTVGARVTPKLAKRRS